MASIKLFSSVQTTHQLVDDTAGACAMIQVFVIKNYKKDGTPFWNRLTITPITDEGGQAENNS